jgi:hypothetical protein
MHNNKIIIKRYNFSSLPNEIIAHILSFLDVQDIPHARLVCKSFNILIRYTEYDHTMKIGSLDDLINAINNYKFNFYEIKYNYKVEDLLQIVRVKNIIFSDKTSWSKWSRFSAADRTKIKKHLNSICCANIYFTYTTCTSITDDTDDFKSHNLNLLCTASLNNKCCCTADGECCCFTRNNQEALHPYPHTNFYFCAGTGKTCSSVGLSEKKLFYGYIGVGKSFSSVGDGHFRQSSLLDSNIRTRTKNNKDCKQNVHTMLLATYMPQTKQNTITKKYERRSNKYAQNKNCHKKTSYKKLKY